MAQWSFLLYHLRVSSFGWFVLAPIVIGCQPLPCAKSVRYWFWGSGHETADCRNAEGPRMTAGSLMGGSVLGLVLDCWQAKPSPGVLLQWPGSHTWWQITGRQCMITDRVGNPGSVLEACVNLASRQGQDPVVPGRILPALGRLVHRLWYCIFRH